MVSNLDGALRYSNFIVKPDKKTFMEEVKLELNEKGNGFFAIRDDGKKLGEMAVSVSNDTLTVYHTEVVSEAEGKGLAGKMLTAMVEHSRNNHLKVIPLCPYVHLQFRRNPDKYNDVWLKDSTEQD